MSNEQKEENNKNNNTNRSSSPNPFLNYLSSSPSNASPRSDTSNSLSASPRSPKDMLQNGMKIPFNGSNITNSMLTAGNYFF